VLRQNIYFDKHYSDRTYFYYFEIIKRKFNLILSHYRAVLYRRYILSNKCISMKGSVDVVLFKVVCVEIWSVGIMFVEICSVKAVSSQTIIFRNWDPVEINDCPNNSDGIILLCIHKHNSCVSVSIRLVSSYLQNICDE
jgi:hypothetical protein